MMNVALVIQDEAIKNSLNTFLKRDSFFGTVEVASHHSTLQSIDPSTADVVFADMGQINAEDIAQLKIHNPSIEIIGVYKKSTEKNDAIVYHLFATLQAPFSYADIVALLNIIKQQLNAPLPARNFIFVKSEYKLVKATFSDIIFILGMKDYTQVYLKGKSSPITTLQNLKEFEKKLPPTEFIRVHRSYIISAAHIDYIARNEIVMGKFNIPIGDAFRSGLYAFLDRHT
jgi:DNA-binding LytR/AlgR family response regulator